jgi:hypothetical protein
MSPLAARLLRTLNATHHGNESAGCSGNLTQARRNDNSSGTAWVPVVATVACLLRNLQR